MTDPSSACRGRGADCSCCSRLRCAVDALVFQSCSGIQSCFALSHTHTHTHRTDQWLIWSPQPKIHSYINTTNGWKRTTQLGQRSIDCFIDWLIDWLLAGPLTRVYSKSRPPNPVAAGTVLGVTSQSFSTTADGREVGWTEMKTGSGQGLLSFYQRSHPRIEMVPTLTYPYSFSQRCFGLVRLFTQHTHTDTQRDKHTDIKTDTPRCQCCWCYTRSVPELRDVTDFGYVSQCGRELAIGELPARPGCWRYCRRMLQLLVEPSECENSRTLDGAAECVRYQFTRTATSAMVRRQLRPPSTQETMGIVCSRTMQTRDVLSAMMYCQQCSVNSAVYHCSSYSKNVPPSRTRTHWLIDVDKPKIISRCNENLSSTRCAKFPTWLSLSRPNSLIVQ